MRRPGRIDMVLQVLPPDAETITRMVHEFVGKDLEKNPNLTGIGETLSGFAPAYIKEACSRARLEALRRTGNMNSQISGEDLDTVAKEVKAEKDMFVGEDDTDQKNVKDMGTLAAGLTAAGKVMADSLAKAQGSAAKTVQ
jgi:SpoVK/Ycf46/Vps4 family AAA+-type ATPase